MVRLEDKEALASFRISHPLDKQVFRDPGEGLPWVCRDCGRYENQVVAKGHAPGCRLAGK